MSLQERDKNAVWHPFTQQEEWCSEEPLIIVSGKGVYLRDIHGRDYIDGNSSIWTNIHGHSHPHIVAAIQRQAAQLDHTSFLGTTHPGAIELAERLVALFPKNSLSRVFFSDNGSTAVEAALKMTFQYWQLIGHPEKKRFVAFSNCYHGDTAGAASLSGIPLFSDRFSGIHFPAEHVASMAELEALPNPESIAAIILEPLIQGVAGMRPWPEGMLRAVRAFCDRNNILLILDEVMTGFGRTGSMFACEQEQITPDLLAMAKGLTGGTVPLAATMVTEKIYAAFLGLKTVTKDVEVAKAAVNAGEIAMTDDGLDLKDVNVTAQVPTVVVKKDTLVKKESKFISSFSNKEKKIIKKESKFIRT